MHVHMRICSDQDLDNKLVALNCCDKVFHSHDEHKGVIGLASKLSDIAQHAHMQ